MDFDTVLIVVSCIFIVASSVLNITVFLRK